VADGRPPPNRSGFVLGLFFVIAGAAFLLDRLDVWSLRLRYLAPVLLIALGVAVLLGGRSSPWRRS
jgi:hypothetical protein